MAEKKIGFLFTFLLLLVTNVNAQVWEIGANVGGAGYIGDLNPTNPIKISGISAGVFARANLSSYWAVGLHYTYGKIKADDADSSNPQLNARNLNFYSPLHEVAVLLDFNFFDYFSGGGRQKFSPYLYAGIGGVIFQPKTEYQGATYKLALYSTEGTTYKNYAFTIPYGAGVKYNVKNNLTLFSQVGYRNAYTDFIDDVSGNYPAADAFNGVSADVQRGLADRSGEKTGVYLGVPKTQRGDFRKRDTYMFVGIGISYTFVSQKCYNF